MDVVNAILDHPTIAGFFDFAKEKLGGLGEAIQGGIKRQQAAASAPRPQRPTPKRPGPPPPKEDPRQVLGFGPQVKLTVEIVKERRKQLAKVFHPDLMGGDNTAMQRVNSAAEVLLRDLA